MLKKTILILLSLLIILFTIPNAYSIVSCTLNFPTANIYDNGTLNLIGNVSAISSGVGNITNITITLGTIEYFNTTINGSRHNYTAGATAVKDDFIIMLNSSLLSEGALTAYATCWNATEENQPSVSLNSSSITYTVDLTNPSVLLSKPNKGQTVNVKGGGFVLFEYTPTDTNLGNSTLYIDGKPYQSSTSGTTSSNLTTGAISRFKAFYSNNNLSRTWIVEVTDLSGRKANSSSFTFNVFARGAPEPETVFVTPSGERISTSAQPKGRPFASGGNIRIFGGMGNLLGNPFVWGSLIVGAVGLFIYYQNRKN